MMQLYDVVGWFNRRALICADRIFIVNTKLLLFNYLHELNLNQTI